MMEQVLIVPQFDYLVIHRQCYSNLESRNERRDWAIPDSLFEFRKQSHEERYARASVGEITWGNTCGKTNHSCVI